MDKPTYLKLMYDAGVKAFKKGETNLSCPYHEEEARISWVSGWYDAFHKKNNKKES